MKISFIIATLNSGGAERALYIKISKCLKNI